jgi:hypothetical protein
MLYILIIILGLLCAGLILKVYRDKQEIKWVTGKLREEREAMDGLEQAVLGFNVFFNAEDGIAARIKDNVRLAEILESVPEVLRRNNKEVVAILLKHKNFLDKLWELSSEQYRIMGKDYDRALKEEYDRQKDETLAADRSVYSRI